MPSSEMLTASTAMMRMRFIRMTPISFGIQNTRNAAYSAGSGHADSQKASRGTPAAATGSSALP